MTNIQAHNITLKEVHRLLGFQEQYDGSFDPLLSLEPVSEAERQELLQIRNEFNYYLTEKQASEGQVRLIAVAPLLRLAGFYRYPIHLDVEENIARINIEDRNTSITGRFDIIAVNRERSLQPEIYFWILVIETKPSLASTRAGLPQLLTYAYKSLDRQESVWGLVTNGVDYQFLYIQQGNPRIYQFMPSLNLFETESSIKLIQVFKAIRNLQNVAAPV